VQRFSIWASLFGVPYERAVRLHRWLGPAIAALAGVHGLGMLGTYALSSIDVGAGYLVLVRPAWAGGECLSELCVPPVYL